MQNDFPPPSEPTKADAREMCIRDSNGTVNSISEDNPVQTLEKVSNNLTIQDGKYILNNRCQKDLSTNNIWGIVIDNSGNVILSLIHI